MCQVRRENIGLAGRLREPVLRPLCGGGRGGLVLHCGVSQGPSLDGCTLTQVSDFLEAHRSPWMLREVVL